MSAVSEILVYIRESDVADYTEQNWMCFRLVGHHGARAGAEMRTWLAVRVM